MRGWREGPQRCWTHKSTREASYKVERLTKRIRSQFQAVGIHLSSAVSFWSVGGRVCRGQKRNQTGRGHPSLNWWTCPLVVATGNGIEDLEVYTPFVHTPTHSIEWKDEFTHKEVGGIVRNEVMVSCLCTPTPINFSQLFQPAPRADSKLPTLPNQPSTSMITPKDQEKAPLFSITLLPLEKVSKSKSQWSLSSARAPHTTSNHLEFLLLSWIASATLSLKPAPWNWACITKQDVTGVNFCCPGVSWQEWS